MSFVSLLGKQIASHEGHVDVSTLSSKAGVMLYFSAHWCPPCRKFTPELATYYKTNKDKMNFEIVFVSSDKDETQFNEYWKEMPWLALPFANRDLKNELSKKYKVKGIPTLVVLDGNGQLITLDGRSKVSTAPEDFPWHPKTFYQIIDNGNPLINTKGQDVSVSSLKNFKAIGIYFSAHWCGPCRTTTPKLIKTYQALKDNKQEDFEIVFATSDSDEESFKLYFSEMPWIALPYKDKRISELSDLYEVEGIPTLVIIDPSTGNVITAEGRGALEADPEGKEFPWHPKSLNSVESAGSALNDEVCFVYIDSNLSSENQTTLYTVAESYCNKWKGGEQIMRFYYGKTGGLTDRLRQFTKVNEDPVIIILNVSAGEYYKVTGSPSEQFFNDTVENFISKSLTPTKFG